MKNLLLPLLATLAPFFSIGQLSISSSGTTTIDFDNTISNVNNGTYAGTGITTSPSTGQLNSNAFAVSGLTQGTLLFGGSQTSGHFSRGTSSGGENPTGLYAFNVASSGTDYAFGIQTSAGQMTPGEVTFQLINNTGSAITLQVGYDIYEYNDQNYSTTINFSHSADNSTYTSESSLQHTTTQSKTNSPAWVSTSKNISLSSVTIANGSSYYLKWTIDDGAGSGSNRDEIALDNISITAQQEIKSTVTNMNGESAQVSSIVNSSSISSTSDGVKVWQLKFIDGLSGTGDSDVLPTIIDKIVFTKGSSNEISDWNSIIRAAALFNGSTHIDNATVYTDSLSFNISSNVNINDNDSVILDLYVSLNTSVTDMENFQFQLEKSNLTTLTAASSSQFGSFSSLNSNVTKNKVDVIPTTMTFVTHPNSGVKNYNLIPGVELKFTDTNGNTDLDGANSSQIRISSSGTLSTSPITSTLNSSGIATFNTIKHTAIGSNLTLTAEDFNNYIGAGSNTTITSNSFNITLASDLFISEVTEPNDNGNARYIELYNAGSTAIDLSATTYYLGVQNNGGNITDVQLTGSIPAKGVYIIASNNSNFTSAYGVTTDLVYGPIGNGNDAILLYKDGDKSSGTIVDIYGNYNEDGSGKNWEYTGKRATRSNSISSSAPNWSSSDWSISSTANVADMTPKRLENEIRHHSADGWVGGTPGSSTGSNDLVVQSGTVTINTDVESNTFTVLNDGSSSISASQTLSVTGDITLLNSGNLTINENGALYQSSSSATNTGNVTIKRGGFNVKHRYNIWSSPVSNANITSVFSNANPCDIYVFDADLQKWKYDFTPNSGSYTCNGNSGIQFGNNDVISTGGADGIMDVGRGYYIPGNTISANYNFSGTPNNGTYTFNVYAAPNPGGVLWSDDNWNLIGNPYPCAIDILHSNSNSFKSVNDSKITGDFYFWIDDGDTANYDQNADFAVFNNTGGTTANGVQAKRYIPAGRGFWVKVIADGTVEFNNNMKVKGNNTSSYKTDNKLNTEKISISLYRNNLSQNILIGLNPQTTVGYDMGWDAPKMDNGGSLTLASICDGGKFSIQSIPPPSLQSHQAIPLFISTKKKGYHRIGIDHTKNLSPQTDVILIDSTENNTYNLLKGEAKLLLDSGEYKHRFFIHFFKRKSTQDTSKVNITEHQPSAIHHYISDNTLFITGDSLIQFSSITVIDLMGRVILHKKNTNNLIKLPLSANIKKGTYIVLLNGKRERKIKINIY